MVTHEVDVLLVGAGLAGIGVAYHLQQKCPNKRYAIVEGRSALGGTWDLFRYPGIRSDSRMHLYGYSFRPWLDDRSIAPGEKILQYLQDTARENGIDQHIHFNTRALRARWSSSAASWTVEAKRTDTQETVTYVCKWLQMCSGYSNGYDVKKHFTPHYEPWDQRVCLSPDGDIFQAISSGTASVVTDHIETFTENGIRLKSGEEIQADVIVTATGLKMLVGGEMAIEVDGNASEQRDHWIYKGVMLSGVPNMMLTAGTLIASYTLRVELIAQYLCRVLEHMDGTGTQQATPQLPVQKQDMPTRPFVSGFNSGYLMRAIDSFPKQGSGPPWVNLQSYQDNKNILEGAVDDGVLAFRS